MENKYKILMVASVFAFVGCQTEDEFSKKGSGYELMFTPQFKESLSTDTRALGDDFFVEGNSITVDLVASNAAGTQSITYTYGADRIFRGNPGFRFHLDDTYVTSLSARWPHDAVRQNGLVTDQRELAAYKSADWLSGGVSSDIEGIMPTDAPVPLVFQRENVLLDFELVGQNTTGLDIESLLIELQSGGNEGSKAFWAYCENPNGHAELILPPGSQILSPDNYLIGRIRVSGQSNDYTIIFPKTDLTLEAGHRYLVTLTPQGYLMNAYVYLTGFIDSDEGIAIPFQKPTPDMNGNFVINNPLQLIGMSYLIRNYDDGRSFVWSERTYIISDDFVLTEEYASQYIPVPQASFNGQILNTSGQNVTEIPYGDGNMLQLFN